MLVYTDLLVLLNSCFDVMLLLLVAVMLKRDIIWLRILTAGIFGAVTVILPFFEWGEIFTHPIMKLTVSLFMIFIAFPYHRFKFFMENLLALYFVTFTVGGGLFAIHYFFQDSRILASWQARSYTSGMGDPFSWLFVLIGFPIVTLFAKQRLRNVQFTKLRYDQLVDVEVIINRQVIQMRGLMDSGNQLTDPLSKSPVIIVEKKVLEKMIPASILNFHINIDIEDDWALKIRLIPYQVVGKRDFLVAFKPDEVRVFYEQTWHCTKKVFVGINSDPLSADGQFACIVHPHLVS